MMDDLKKFRNPLEFDFCNKILIAFCAHKHVVLEKNSPLSQFSRGFEPIQAIKIFYWLYILKLLSFIFNLSPSGHL